MSDQLKKGDLVRVKNPEEFLLSFARRIKDRNAIVRWVGPDMHGQFKGRCSVLFLKKNGRGKEFPEIMRIADLILVEESDGGQS